MRPVKSRTLIALPCPPALDPPAWADAHAHGPSAVAVVSRPIPWPSPADATWTDLSAGITRLVRAGVLPLGHVSLGYATRPLVDVLGEIAAWARLPVTGVFLDHAPAGPFQVGPVVHAVRAARRAGIATVVLNPGVPVDPVYRRLDATLCTFEGSWTEYLSWTGLDGAPGDGHLVYGVPEADLDTARTLARRRGAGLVLVSARGTPTLGGRPAINLDAAAAGSAGRSTTSGS